MAGLGMLTPLNANAQPATILPSGNGGALAQALARNKEEDALAQAGLAAKAAAAGAADKAKEENKGAAAKRMAELGKETVFRHYGIEWKGMFNGYVDEYAKASQLHAQDPTKYGDPDDPGTEAGSYFYKKAMDLHQAKKSSDDIQTQYEADMAYYKANETKFRPGALQALEAKYADPAKWKNGEIIDKPLELWDLEGNVKATFGAMKDEVIASAGPSGDGGAMSWSLERPVSGALKGLAQTFAADAWADGSLQERFKALSDPARERINALAQKNGMSPGEALALDMATNLYGATKTTKTYSAPNKSGRGAKEDEATARELIENVKGLVSGAAQDKKGGVTAAQQNDFVTKFKVDTKGRFDKEADNLEVYTNLNGRTYSNSLEPKAANNVPSKIRGVVRFSNGDIVVAHDNLKTNSLGKSVVDGETPLKYSERIPKDEVWSRLGIEVAKNDPAYNLGAVETVFEKDYSGVKGTFGQVPLGGKRGAWDLNDAGELE